MPLPLILVAIAVGTGALGAGKTIEGIAKGTKAKKTSKEAKRVFSDALEKLNGQRKGTEISLAKLGEKRLFVYHEKIHRFVKLFTSLKNVDLKELNLPGVDLPPFTNEALGDMKRASLNAGEILLGGVAGLGAGALAGVAAYGGATLLASASTGTAITALSGIAAQNATLAWFGGGSLATGGAGIAGGTLVLGGLITGPFLLVSGLITSGKARKALAQAKANLAKAKVEAKKADVACKMLVSIKVYADQIHSEISRLQGVFTRRLNQLESLISEFGTDYRKYGEKGKRLVHVTVLTAQLMRGYLDLPILTKNGNLSRRVKKELEGLGNMRNQIR
jgi:hypothetical protein